MNGLRAAALMVAPAGTAASIVSRLHAEGVKALKTPEIREFKKREGAAPVGSSPQELSVHFRNEVDRYTKVIRAANIQLD